MTVVERIHYFALPGMEAEVLATRREASRLRLELGLRSGQIRRRLGEQGPDVVWECSFSGAEEQARDLAVRDASDAFNAIRARMDTLLMDSARLVEKVALLDAGDEPAP